MAQTKIASGTSNNVAIRVRSRVKSGWPYPTGRWQVSIELPTFRRLSKIQWTCSQGNIEVLGLLWKTNSLEQSENSSHVEKNVISRGNTPAVGGNRSHGGRAVSKSKFETGGARAWLRFPPPVLKSDGPRKYFARLSRPNRNNHLRPI